MELIPDPMLLKLFTIVEEKVGDTQAMVKMKQPSDVNGMGSGAMIKTLKAVSVSISHVL